MFTVPPHESEDGDDPKPLPACSQAGSDKFLSGTTSAYIQSNMTSQPRPLFETEAKNSLKHEAALTSESSRLFENQYANMGSERDAHVAAQDQHTDSNNVYLKYRPRTTRYQEAGEQQFAIITE